MVTDPIADYLTKIRNAVKARHRIVEVPLSKTKLKITEVLHDQGYINNYEVDNAAAGRPVIKIALRYDAKTKVPVISHIRRLSKPGLRKYYSVKEIPQVLNGLGITVMSTSKGIMTDKMAKKINVGGEALCCVY
jgi:small subunit ribosomal protein S8